MNKDELLKAVQNISIWKRGDQRAPHKPLLILYALAQIHSNQNQLLPYSEVKGKLTDLLKEFGPKRASYHPEEPFVRLARDGIWELQSTASTMISPTNKNLLAHDAKGGFTTEVYNLFLSEPSLIQQVAESVLYEHFPDTLHEDILAHVGLDLDAIRQADITTYTTQRKRRDPRFRDKILRAYEYSCAVCGFNVRLGSVLVGVEAAHIKWHQAGGPDEEDNGIALCSMHHKLFDRGVFTINESRNLIVAEEAHGTNGFQEWLYRFHDHPMRKPINPKYQPKNQFLHWHVREVFKGPGRHTNLQ